MWSPGLSHCSGLDAFEPRPVRQPIFRARIDLVTVGVTVTDRRGNFVTDLTPDDFEIIEDGRKQTITYFARGDEATSSPPLHRRPAVRHERQHGRGHQARALGRRPVPEHLSDAEDMTLVDFDTEVRVAKYRQRDFPRMVERIRGRQPAGGRRCTTRLACISMAPPRTRAGRFWWSITDGGDTRSTIGFADVMTLVRASDVTIHTVGFLEHQSSGARLMQRMRLMEIAETTGGQAFFPSA